MNRDKKLELIERALGIRHKLKVQLKGRLTFERKYQNKNVYICFCDQAASCWYLYPHDKLLESISKVIGNSKSWNEAGSYSFASLSTNIKSMLSEYRFE